MCDRRSRASRLTVDLLRGLCLNAAATAYLQQCFDPLRRRQDTVVCSAELSRAQYRTASLDIPSLIYPSFHNTLITTQSFSESTTDYIQACQESTIMSSMHIDPGLLQEMLSHPNQSYKRQLIAVTVICCSAAFLSVVLRFIARRIGKTGHGWDDPAIVCSLVSVITQSVQCFASSCRQWLKQAQVPAFGYSILMAAMTRIGLGVHIIYVKPEWARPLSLVSTSIC